MSSAAVVIGALRVNLDGCRVIRCKILMEKENGLTQRKRRARILIFAPTTHHLDVNLLKIPSYSILVLGHLNNNRNCFENGTV